MDTLTLFIRIIDTVVQCAKAVGLLIALFLLFFTVRTLPMRLSGLLPRVANVCLFLAFMTSYDVNRMLFASFDFVRLIAVLSSLTVGVSLFMVLIAAVSCLDNVHSHSAIRRIAVEAFCNQRVQKRQSRGKFQYISSSYLATTPVLLA